MWVEYGVTRSQVGAGHHSLLPGGPPTGVVGKRCGAGWCPAPGPIFFILFVRIFSFRPGSRHGPIRL